MWWSINVKKWVMGNVRDFTVNNIDLILCAVNRTNRKTWLLGPMWWYRKLNYWLQHHQTTESVGLSSGCSASSDLIACFPSKGADDHPGAWTLPRMRKTRWSAWLLPSAWSSPNCCGHLRNSLVPGEALSDALSNKYIPEKKQKLIISNLHWKCQHESFWGLVGWHNMLILCLWHALHIWVLV